MRVIEVMRMWTSRLPLGFLLTCVLAVALAGCGSGGNGGDAPVVAEDVGGVASAPVTPASPPAIPVGEPVVIVPAQPGVAGSMPGPPPGAPLPAPEDDPAAALDGGGEVTVAQAAAPETAGFQVDLVGRRVYLPRWGWLAEEHFWEIYYNVPQDLPPDLDFEALRRLGYPVGGHGGE